MDVPADRPQDRPDASQDPPALPLHVVLRIALMARNKKQMELSWDTRMSVTRLSEIMNREIASTSGEALLPRPKSAALNASTSMDRRASVSSVTVRVPRSSVRPETFRTRSLGVV